MKTFSTPLFIDPQTGRERIKRPSRITVPARANPLAKLVFAEMKRQGFTYLDLEMASGVLTSTFKAWRGDNSPGLLSIEAALGALGITLVPVPKLDTLPETVRKAVEEIGQHYVSDEQALGSLILAAAEFPEYARKHVRPRVIGSAA